MFTRRTFQDQCKSSETKLAKSGELFKLILKAHYVCTQALPLCWGGLCCVCVWHLSYVNNVFN